MFTMLSGVRLNACGANRQQPYVGSISSNLGGHNHMRTPYSQTSLGINSRSREHHRDRELNSEVRLIEVILDKDVRPVFEPGQEVCGKIVVVVAASSSYFRFRSLSVSMKGVARARWTESRSVAATYAVPQRRDAEDEYFNKKRFVLAATGERHVLNEGRHEFEFRFRLPRSDQLATSFEGKFGSVRYFVKAELEQSLMRTHRAKKAFTVILPVDVNTPEMLSPVSREAEKTLCCWPCSAGMVTMAVTTDRTGYCPGESVAIDAGFASTNTRRRMTPEAALFQRQTFSVGSKTRTKTTRFTSLLGRPFSSSEGSWEALLLKIPPGISPSITNCKLIRVEYYVRVGLSIQGALNLSVALPVIIGTVPLRRSIPEPRQVTPVAVPMPLVELDNDPPPSYTECVTEAAVVDLAEAEDFSETSSLYGETRFVPLYRYVTDYTYQAPPAYAEVDPYPMATTSTVVTSTDGATRLPTAETTHNML